MGRKIRVGLLVPHPENSNHMDTRTLEKLQRHIRRTGNYEPLAVRPHPRRKGEFEIINGHNRLKALKALGHRTADCIVWDVDTDQTRLYLATLNRLSGSEVPERRVHLLDRLLNRFEVADLAALLPEPEGYLADLKAIVEQASADFDSIASSRRSEPALPVIMEFMLTTAEAQQVNAALDLATDQERKDVSRGTALVRRQVPEAGRTRDRGIRLRHPL